MLVNVCSDTSRLGVRYIRLGTMLCWPSFLFWVLSVVNRSRGFSNTMVGVESPECLDASHVCYCVLKQ